MTADMIGMGMRREEYQRLVRKRSDQRTQRRHAETAVDEDVRIAAGDQEAVGANEAMAMRLRNAVNAVLDFVHREPGCSDGKAHDGFRQPLSSLANANGEASHRTRFAREGVSGARSAWHSGTHRANPFSESIGWMEGSISAANTVRPMWIWPRVGIANAVVPMKDDDAGLAERAGFEPALGINLNTLSRRAT